MVKVIIHKNENGNVSVTSVVDANLTIEEVQAKDCPEGSLIVDSSELPQDADDFFNAWRLADGKVSVDFAAAKAIAIGALNDRARIAYQLRQSNFAIGINNSKTDQEFIDGVKKIRSSIEVAETIAALRTAMNGDF